MKKQENFLRTTIISAIIIAIIGAALSFIGILRYKPVIASFFYSILTVVAYLIICNQFLIAEKVNKAKLFLALTLKLVLLVLAIWWLSAVPIATALTAIASFILTLVLAAILKTLFEEKEK